MFSLFRLGDIVATAAALLALEGNHDSPEWEGWQLLARHSSGDWGEVSEVNAHENDLSVELGFRILSVYTTRVARGCGSLPPRIGAPRCCSCQTNIERGLSTEPESSRGGLQPSMVGAGRHW